MKNTFVLRANYEELFQELQPAQAGEVIQAVFAYVNQRAVPAFSDAQARIVFKCIQKDIAYDLEKYEKSRAKWVANGRKGGRPKKTQKTAGLPPENENPKTKQNPNVDVDEDVDVEMRRDDNYISTARAENGPAQDTQVLSQKEKTTTATTTLQQFCTQVLERFEPTVQTQAQKEIWLKRNVRCLKDILRFCGENIPLALQTIRVCARRLEKSGLTGGYEAVCRNLPEYHDKAQKELEGAAHV